MKYLLDTHALLWIASDDPRLSSKAKTAYLNAENEIYISIASLWEMTIKLSRKRLKLDKALEDFIQEDIIGNDISILQIKPPHLYVLLALPFHHNDPFDRIIISQSSMENMLVLSADKIFDKYMIKRVW